MLERAEEKLYRVYVTDSLSYAPQSKYIPKRYVDMIEAPQKVEKRSAEDIAQEVIEKAGITVI